MRLYYEDDPDRVVIIGGRPLREVKIELPQGLIDRLANGYACLRCLEPLSTAYPDVCPNEWCGYEIKKNQPDDFRACLEEIGLYEPPDDYDYDYRKRAARAGIIVPRSIATS
jgi:hypothetical protein